MLNRKLCNVHVFLLSLHSKFLAFSLKVQFIQTEQLSKILSHFKGSECEIAFFKFKSKFYFILICKVHIFIQKVLKQMEF